MGVNQMLERLNKKAVLAIVFIITIFIFWSGGKYYGWKNVREDIQIVDEVGDEKSQTDESDQENKDEESEISKSLIMVHIYGAVENPGIYELIEGSRVDDALKLARPTSEALIDKYLNRAKILVDEAAIFVPTLEDLENSHNSQANLLMEDGFNSLNQEKNSNAQININTASAAELQKLPGIGAVKAEAILQYRENNGKFKTIDDLANVTGIGAVTLENLKEQISVR